MKIFNIKLLGEEYVLSASDEEEAKAKLLKILERRLKKAMKVELVCEAK